MLLPSGEICGSFTHCRSKTSSGLKTGFTICAKPGAGNTNRNNAASPSHRRSFMPITCACNPAIALMFIYDSHGLHEGVANGRSDETETSLLEVLAHPRAVRGRRREVAQ